MLQDLPSDVLYNIARHLTQNKTLATLGLTCKNNPLVPLIVELIDKEHAPPLHTKKEMQSYCQKNDIPFDIYCSKTYLKRSIALYTNRDNRLGISAGYIQKARNERNRALYSTCKFI